MKSTQLTDNVGIGNVGIGTTAPASLLHISGSNNNAMLNISNGTNSVLFVNGTTERVGIGTTSPSAILHTATNNAPNIFFQAADTGINGVHLIARKSRGTIASPTAVSSGDRIGLFLGQGYNGTSFAGVGGMAVLADGTPSTFTPTRIEFWTATGSADENIRMTIKNDGNLGIGTTSPQSALHIDGFTSTDKHIQLDVNTTALASTDCDTENERGRMIVDNSTTSFKLWVCFGGNGWKSTALT